MARKVKGLDRLLLQIATLPKSVVTTVGPQIGSGAEDLAGRIRTHAPRSDKDHEHMADGVKAVPVTAGETNSKGALTAAGVKAIYGLAFKVVCPAPGRWVEFGTKARAGDYHDERGHLRHAGHGHHATAPHPFFWPTVRAWRKPNGARIRKAGRDAAKALKSV